MRCPTHWFVGVCLSFGPKKSVLPPKKNINILQITICIFPLCAMPMNDLRAVLDAQLANLGSEALTDDEIRALNLICGPELLLASLELIDRKAG
ncbi:hypothetical protein CROQUDRAFT_382575 [Cronartium quercuum f. sp. fusiforme G11]|uniref:Uncharacterized protein n=1 Tax=Cronartium quercuum f. sp. fusiforme G11 TaxID=708437 RepID=A0A9P6T765_9BASI|nr:hypothetical protein CROQUDRAFT_382575 [Cronartium quercuum f. sp. fusiforme G11]